MPVGPANSLLDPQGSQWYVTWVNCKVDCKLQVFLPFLGTTWLLCNKSPGTWGMGTFLSGTCLFPLWKPDSIRFTFAGFWEGKVLRMKIPSALKNRDPCPATCLFIKVDIQAAYFFSVWNVGRSYQRFRIKGYRTKNSKFERISLKCLCICMCACICMYKFLYVFSRLLLPKLIYTTLCC